ncbi:Spy/CpxP family protein refolding chaperone [Brachyspira innocens]|uniref:Spy/CpxP family protein refolding chaperone n=1 Tax=Brachyspira innocens TaxID=13264 RepID=UPI0026EBEF0B|nr:periplasmic heavy metal sensor [Brachyspira innocens]
MTNKINKKAIILISIAIMIFGSVSLFAQYGRGYGRGYGAGYGAGYGRGGCGAGYGRGYYGAGYGRCGAGYGRGYYGYYNNQLTQEQIDQIRTIQDKYFPQMDTLRREIYNQTQNINAEMRKDAPDQNAINAAIDARSKASADLQKLRTQCFLEIDKVYQNK